MKNRLNILVVLVLAMAGILYWKGDRSYREQAGLQPEPAPPQQALTAEEVMGPAEPPPRADDGAGEIAATQVPGEDAEGQDAEAATQEAPSETTAVATMPGEATAETETEMAQEVTAAVDESAVAEAASDDAIVPLPFAWMSPAQENQPGFVAPDRDDARQPSLVLRRNPPNAPDLNRLFDAE